MVCVSGLVGSIVWMQQLLVCVTTELPADWVRQVLLDLTERLLLFSSGAELELQVGRVVFVRPGGVLHIDEHQVNRLSIALLRGPPFVLAVKGVLRSLHQGNRLLHDFVPIDLSLPFLFALLLQHLRYAHEGWVLSLQLLH